jgi:PAS domain S-box-containing protein
MENNDYKVLTENDIKKKLSHSHNLMRYIIEHSRSAIAVHDKDLKYIYVSQRYLQEYNIKDPDVIGKHHYDVFPDLPQKWRDVHQQALAGIVSSAEDDPYFREDGTTEWTRWECRPWYESDGSIGGIIVYTEVITARKNAEIALKESEEKYRLIVENNHDIIYTLTSDGIFSFVSNAWTKQLGHQLADVVGHSFEEFVHKDDLPACFVFLKSVVEGGVPKDGVEYRVKHIDGTLYWHTSSGVPLKDESGKVSGFYGIARDITQRKKFEENLSIISKAVESATDAIGISDANGYHFYQNKALSDLFEYSTAEELQSAGGGSAVVKDPEVAKEMFNNIKSGKSWSGELKMVTKSGKILDCYERADAIIDNDNKILGLIGIITDITARKQSEESLKKKIEELEWFNKMMVNREVKMIELKKEVNDLLLKLGEKEKYVIHEKGE